MSLYTVEISRKQIITRFLDKKGKKSVTFEEIVKQTYHDLPLCTAMTYKDLDPAVIITEQVLPVGRQKTQITSQFHTRGNSTAVQSKGGFRRAEKKEPEATFVPREVIGASKGYAEVVNEMMKDVA